MSEAAIGILGGFLLVGLTLTYMFVSENYGFNPLKWRPRRREVQDYKQVERISILEHDLGYTPCSDDSCYSCKRMLKERGTDYTDQFARMVYAKAMPPLPIAEPSTIKK